MAGYFGLESREVIRVHVKKFDGLMQPDNKKFSLDPQITSFEMLQNILARAFDIKSDFTISYLSREEKNHEVYLSMLSDWDMDAAFQNAALPFLQLKVDLRPFDEGLEDWDVIAPADIPQYRMITWLGRDSLLGSITGSISTHVGKTMSQMQKVIGLKIEDESQFRPLKSPMTDLEFRNYLDSDGHMVKPEEFRLSIYQGGVEPVLRRVVWRHLLNIFPTDMSGRERFDYMKAKELEYYKLRDQWKQLFSHGLVSKEAKNVASMVKKDVLRTDRGHKCFAGGDENKNLLSLFNLLVTYALTHPEVSYCQGMSDLASPLLVVQKDEAQAYLCFCGLMNRLAFNFCLDGKAITAKFQNLSNLVQIYDPHFYTYMKEHGAEDLFFCYRWLLLEMKREFPFEDALYMLEVMWSTLPPNPPKNSLALTEPDFNSKLLSTSPHSPTFTMKQTLYANLLAKRRSSASLKAKELNLPKSKLPIISDEEATSCKIENNESSLQDTDSEILNSKLNMIADENYNEVCNHEIISNECSIMPNENNNCSKNGMSPSSPNDIIITENPVYQDICIETTKDCSKAQPITSARNQWYEHSMQDILVPCIPSGQHSDNDGAPMQFHLSMEMPGNSKGVDKRLIKSAEKIPDIKGSFFSGMIQILTSPKKRSRTVKQPSKQVSHKGKTLNAHTSAMESTKNQDNSGIAADLPPDKSADEHKYVSCQMENVSMIMSPNSENGGLEFNEIHYANSPDSQEKLADKYIVEKPCNQDSEKLLDKEDKNLESQNTHSGEEVSQDSLSSEEDSIYSQENHSSCNKNCAINCDDQDKNGQIHGDSKGMKNCGVKSTITRRYDLNGSASLLQSSGSDYDDNSNKSIEMDSVCHQVSDDQCISKCQSDLTDAPDLSLFDSVKEGGDLKNTRKLPPPEEFGMGNPFLMFLCLSILMQHRDHIMKSKMEYEELAMYFDRMVRRHNVHRVLHQTRALYAEYLRQHKKQSEEIEDFDLSV
ncbi:hypothetical protein CHS0354_029697 [Potamilus streckersoni]|uniref:Rab-GAP TBC domain-containing protein n=1 Tax=Potamilus streckersoni TaxID=2493646 RepID=A0AAE0VIS7_9BIVA|nr:hypothetical protein CHS0354_029697 [Potamilus streckersoni]